MAHVAKRADEATGELITEIVNLIVEHSYSNESARVRISFDNLMSEWEVQAFAVSEDQPYEEHHVASVFEEKSLSVALGKLLNKVGSELHA